MSERYSKITEIIDRIRYGRGNPTFIGQLDSAKDRSAAGTIAAGCLRYAIDEDDEDYLEGARSCFNCRYRRWTADGFSCLRGFPNPFSESP